ncbi:hypothetical protein [Pseudonocardia sp. TRM90224]|uniref:hypothetical protein n=1 Tax=Pseudonocardia sp. TRM90224 TaxID=2812678 RepID=UPI001E53E371|nr:hypothetical protein [Pseudonocardia sp. TRM90224]
MSTVVVTPVFTLFVTRTVAPARMRWCLVVPDLISEIVFACVASEGVTPEATSGRGGGAESSVPD